MKKKNKYLRSLSDNNYGYWILIAVIMLATFMYSINWIYVHGADDRQVLDDTEEVVLGNSTGGKHYDWWEYGLFWNWPGMAWDAAQSGPLFQIYRIFTFDLEILGILGVWSQILRIMLTAMIAVGIVDIVWIG